MADSAAPAAGRVFISYRREETACAAGWLFDRLVDRFGRGQIFKDIDSIQLGDDFVEVITTAVASCDVLLALIGEQWLTITDEHGTARLENPDDYLRLEIEAALTRDVRVIPILVAGARMPRPDQLPPSLAKLVRRHALELSPSHFESDTLASAELGRAAGIVPLLQSLANVNDHIRALAGFHETYDLFLTPTLARPPLAVGALTTPNKLQKASRVVARTRTGKLLAASGAIRQIIDDNLGWVPYTQLANLTGRPAISVPLHWTATGLPLGVQLVGRLGADGALLQLAAQLEEARPWFQRYADLDPALTGR